MDLGMRRLLEGPLGIFRSKASKAADRFSPNAQRDIFLVTYPRSGTTWLSCIAGELMFNISPKSLTEIDSLVPDIHAMPKRSTVPSSRQYLVKSHLPLSGQPPYGSYRRVIYLIRDPRDVMLSYYRFEVAQSGRKGDIRAFAKDWASGRIWPGSWQEHVNTWIGPYPEPRSFELTMLRYEDFISHPVEQTTRLAEVIGVQASRDRIEEVVADTNPDIMRSRERQGNAGAKPSLQFIGPATSGGWKDKLIGKDLEALQIVEEYAGPVMRRHGYKLSSTS